MLKVRDNNELKSFEDGDVPVSEPDFTPSSLTVEAKGPRVVPPPADPESREAEKAPQDAPGAKPDAEASPPAPAKRHRLRRLVIVAVALIALGAGGWYGHYWWTTGRFLVSTDDAYVGAHTATLAAKVSGYISSIDVRDNQEVHPGEVIARIDDGDYKLAVQSARDNVAIQQAAIARIGKQVDAQDAAVSQAKAQLNSANAAAKQAELELVRQQQLANRDYASRQALEQAQANRDQTAAAVEGAKAGVTAAETNVAVLKAQQQEAEQTLKQQQTALAKAERDLSFTVIRAPIDGVIGNRAMQVGDYVQPGQRLAALVPLGDVYIDANFKETQLSDLRPGQPVTVSVDALPDHDLKGSVVSVAPASGSVFSLLPPDNATGNFTKIVQRIPVRIRVPVSDKKHELLRPGMSVVVTVDAKPGATEGGSVAAVQSVK